MKFESYRISELIEEIAMGPFGSNIKEECVVDNGIPDLNGSTLYTDILLTSHTLKIGAESIHLLLRFLFCQQVPYLTLSTVERAIYYFNNEHPVRKLNGKPPVLFRTERVA